MTGEPVPVCTEHGPMTRAPEVRFGWLCERSPLACDADYDCPPELLVEWPGPLPDEAVRFTRGRRRWGSGPNGALLPCDLVPEVDEATAAALAERFLLPGPCYARSPESDLPCVLADTAAAHPAGHESARINGTRAVWASTDADRRRWRA